MFGKLFKPRWQHQDAEVRLKAVSLLDNTNPEQRDALLALAHNDNDTAVRCEAIERLTDLTRLVDLYRKDSCETVRAAAAQRLLLLLGSDAEASALTRHRVDIVQQLDAPLLIQLLAGNTTSACQDAALAQLNDDTQLFEVAITGQHATLREQAAAKIVDATLLRRLSREGRDKKVLQQARDRLKQQQQREQLDAQRLQQINALLQQIEQHAARGLDPLYEARTTALHEHWQALCEHADSAQLARATQGLSRADQMIAATHKEEADKQARAEAQHLQQQHLNTLRELFDGIDITNWEQPNALSTAWRCAQESWYDSCRTWPADASMLQTFQQLDMAWQQLMASFVQLQTLAADWQTPARDTDEMQLDNLISQWPNKVPLPAFVTPLCKKPQTPDVAAARLPRPAVGQRHQRARHAGLLHHLRQALKARHLKDANRAWQRLGQALDKHPDDNSTQQAVPLKTQLDELRDWHAFAAAPKKQQLCEQMSQLAEAPLTHPEEQANAIQALHEMWHELMSSDQQADQRLWDTFKQASDKAYDSCREHFKELDRQRADNLVVRLKIVEQLDNFIESGDWLELGGQPLWEIRRQAPKDWQQASPVAFTEARAANQRFSQRLKQIDAHLKDISSQHQPELLQLLEALTQLAAQDDVGSAARDARQLQRDWRTAGWVHPQAYRKLDKQKRQLCDAIFKRLHEQQAANKAAQQLQNEHLQQQLDDLKQLLAADNSSIELLDKAVDAVKQATSSGGRAQQAAAQKLLDTAHASRTQLQRAQKWTLWQQRVKVAPAGEESAELRQLCVALEATAGCDSPASAKSERLAWQVDRLATAMTGSQQDQHVNALRLFYESAALIDAGLNTASRERLLKAIDSLIGG